MYEFCLAVRTMVVLDQNVVGLVTQEMAAMGTDIFTLKGSVHFLTFLRDLR